MDIIAMDITRLISVLLKRMRIIMCITTHHPIKTMIDKCYLCNIAIPNLIIFSHHFLKSWEMVATMTIWDHTQVNNSTKGTTRQKIYLKTHIRPSRSSGQWIVILPQLLHLPRKCWNLHPRLICIMDFRPFQLFRREKRRMSLCFKSRKIIRL